MQCSSTLATKRLSAQLNPETQTSSRNKSSDPLQPVHPVFPATPLSTNQRSNHCSSSLTSDPASTVNHVLPAPVLASNSLRDRVMQKQQSAAMQPNVSCYRSTADSTTRSNDLTSLSCSCQERSSGVSNRVNDLTSLSCSCQGRSSGVSNRVCRSTLATAKPPPLSAVLLTHVCQGLSRLSAVIKPSTPALLATLFQLGSESQLLQRSSGPN